MNGRMRAWGAREVDSEGGKERRENPLLLVRGTHPVADRVLFSTTNYELLSETAEEKRDNGNEESQVR